MVAMLAFPMKATAIFDALIVKHFDELCLTPMRWNGFAWVPDGPERCGPSYGLTGVTGDANGNGIGTFEAGPTGPSLGATAFDGGPPTLYGWSPGEIKALGQSASGFQYLSMEGSGSVLRRMRADIPGSLETIGGGGFEIEDLDEGLDGNLWGVSNDKLLLIDRFTGAQTLIATLGINAVGITANSEGRLWIADAHNVYDFNPGTNSLTHFMSSPQEVITDLGSTAVPEPATLIVLAAAGAVLMRRKPTD